MNAVVSRMSDSTIARFVARNVIDATTPTDRLAVAFQALVKDDEDRERLLALAQKDVAESPLGNTDGFEGVWNQVAEKLLTSYRDKPFVSDEYAPRALGRADAGHRRRAGQRRSRRSGSARWLSTVATTRPAGARSDAGARPAAHRGRRRALGRDDDAGRRADRGSAARRRFRRGDAARRRARRRKRRGRPASPPIAGSTRSPPSTCSSPAR